MDNLDKQKECKHVYEPYEIKITPVMSWVNPDKCKFCGKLKPEEK